MSKKIFKYDDAPIFEIFISEDDDTGIRLVSLVEDPAIEISGMAFSKKELANYEFKNIKDKQLIVGPALVPNKKIIRKDEDGDPYFVFFSEDTIKLMVEKFNKNNNNKSINIDHTTEMVKSAYIQQSWIVSDSYYDKSKMYGYSLPIGTWFIEVKIDNSDEWEKYVKQGGRYSFSVEGLMGQSPSNFSMYDIIDGLTKEELIYILNDLKN